MYAALYINIVIIKVHITSRLRAQISNDAKSKSLIRHPCVSNYNRKLNVKVWPPPPKCWKPWCWRRRSPPWFSNTSSPRSYLPRFSSSDKTSYARQCSNIAFAFSLSSSLTYLGVFECELAIRFLDFLLSACPTKDFVIIFSFDCFNAASALL